MTPALRLLLVEDSVTDAKLVLHAIRGAGHTVKFDRVQDEAAMREALADKKWDAVISDWSMPNFSARGALSVLKETKLDLPFIIVSGTVGEEVAVEAMRAGAHDYVLKDKLARLPAVLERELRECKLREAHRQGQARFSRLAESGIIGMTTGDENGTILEANDTFLRMVGFTRQELAQGKLRWRDLSAPEASVVMDRGDQELRARGIATPYEKTYIRRDGTRVPVLIGIAMTSETRSVAFIVDLSAQKRAEEGLRKSEEQLRHAQKMEAVGRLAGGVAHDFNNMLSVILSYGEMINADLAPESALRADVEEIRKAARRAADLTRQLLLFSRQEVLEPRVLDLNDLLTNMERMLQRLLGEDVNLTSTRAAMLGRVRVDPGHIEQVVMNLVVNARDAMPTGGALTIETKRVVLDEAFARAHLGVTSGPHVLLSVSDTGTGMDAETMAHIFEPFFTTKERGKGTGLGLSTVFGIVQQCGGTIWVRTEVGKGTTFEVYLPSVEEEADAPATTSLSPATLYGSETVLLAEDEDQVRNVACSILRKHGYRVIEARNATEALLRAENHPGPIHLLVTDVVMPQMSGPELAKRLLRARPEVKVLCVSGYTDDAPVRHGAMAAGMAFLQKPFTPEKLARKVREVLDAR